MRAKYCCALLVILGLLVSPLKADEFLFKPPENFVLNPKFIGLHHPVETESNAGQLYFDQGLTFIYAFNHEAAYWSFLRASEADPKMAMAYWGMALAVGMNINSPITPERSKVAYKAVQKAIELVSQGIETEQNYIQALAKRYSVDPHADQKKLNLSYSNAMGQLSAKYVDDLDAATLYAESLLDLNPWEQWSVEGKPLKGTMQAVRTLESILKRDPDHIGANHYFVHAVEASPHPEIALMSAERLKTLLPSSGHLLHMPSHIYMLVGDYHQAAIANEVAIAADRLYIRKFGSDGNYPIHYMTHNYYVLIRAYTMEGSLEEAKGAAEDLVEFYAPHFHKMPELEYYAFAPYLVMINFQRWNDLLQMPAPPKEMEVNTVLWRFGRALAFAKLGDVAKAQEEKKLFLEGKSALPAAKVFGYNHADKILIIAEQCLNAQLAEAQGNTAQAVEWLKKGAKEQDRLHYNEPPDWFFPVRQALGGLFLRMQKPVEAEAVLREELNRHPRSGRALYGLKESLKDQGKLNDLYWVNEAFQKSWKYSDIPLSINSL